MVRQTYHFIHLWRISHYLMNTLSTYNKSFAIVIPEFPIFAILYHSQYQTSEETELGIRWKCQIQFVETIIYTKIVTFR